MWCGNDSSICSFGGLRTVSFIYLPPLQWSFDTFSHLWASLASQSAKKTTFLPKQPLQCLWKWRQRKREWHAPPLSTGEGTPALSPHLRSFPVHRRTLQTASYPDMELQRVSAIWVSGFAIIFIIQHYKRETEVRGSYKVTQETCSSAGNKNIGLLTTVTNKLFPFCSNKGYSAKCL